MESISFYMDLIGGLSGGSPWFRFFFKKWLSDWDSFPFGCAGKAMLRNFLFGISGLEATYTMEAREQHCIDYIRRVVGSDKVLFF